MSPEQMPQEEAGADKVGVATKLAQQGGEVLSKLSEMLNGSKATTENDRAQMAQIMELYIDLVERKLGGAAPGEDAPAEELPADQGAVPMQGGMKGVPMGPQNKM